MTITASFKGLKLAVLSAAAGFSLTAAALAQAPTSQLETIQSRGALQICTTGDYKPFTLANDFPSSMSMPSKLSPAALVNGL